MARKKKGRKYLVPALSVFGAALVVSLGVALAVSSPVVAEGGNVFQFSAAFTASEIRDLACTLFDRGCPEPEASFGALPGGEVFSELYAKDGFISGDSATTTTYTATTDTMVRNDFVRHSIFNVTPPAGGLTLTTFASTSVRDYMSIVGDTKTITINNQASSDVMLTLAAGTGVDLEIDLASTTPACLCLSAGDSVRLEFQRLPTTDAQPGDFKVFAQFYTDAD